MSMNGKAANARLSIDPRIAESGLGAARCDADNADRRQIGRRLQQGKHQAIKVLILIPTLTVGGAEMDLVRNLPLLDRSRFKTVVCAFLEHGPLAKKLTDAGIEVIGPFSEQASWLQYLRLLVWRVTRPLWELALRVLPTHSLSVLWKLTSRLLPAHSLSILRELKSRLLSAFQPRIKDAALHSLSVLLNSLPTPALKVAPRVLNVAAYFLSDPHKYLRMSRPIGHYIQAAEIDVVHAILPNSYLLGAIANSLAGWRPLVMSRVSLNFYDRAHKLLGVVEKNALHRMVDPAIGNSAVILQELRGEGVPAHRLRLVYNGIDPEVFKREMIDRHRARERLGIASHKLILSSVARLFPYKGHIDLMNALHRLRDRLSTDWILLVVGRDVNGSLGELTRLAAEMKLSSHVHLLGERDDIPLILSAADIHVSASHHEGLPNNIVEAMCAGLPVAATAVGGVPELVVDGVTGLLVPARNPALMADALYCLATDAGRRIAMGRAGRARVESHFTVERSVAAFEEIYAELAARPLPVVSADSRRSRAL